LLLIALSAEEYQLKISLCSFKQSLSALSSDTLNVCFSFCTKHQVSHPQKTTLEGNVCVNVSWEMCFPLLPPLRFWLMTENSLLSAGIPLTVGGFGIKLVTSYIH
jgi:hypothetical protein